MIVKIKSSRLRKDRITEPFEIQIDECDIELVNSHKWHIVKGYVSTNIRVDGKKKRHGSLHRMILGDKCKGKVVDHINRDRLDNRRCNLRVCSVKHNAWNSNPHKDSKLKLKGVTYMKHRGTYQASIMISGKKNHLGTYKTAEEAAEVYKRKSIELHGEFSCFNN